jgi:hypothetical protein
MTRKFNPETRKSLVAAMAEILGTKQKYLGVKTCAYQVGDYNVAKDGTMTGPENPELIEALLAAGFAPEAPETEEAQQALEAADPAPAPQAEAPAEDEAPEFPTTPEHDLIVIEYPREGFTPEKLDNLCKMVSAKEELIKLAIGAQELPIQVDDEKISFPWLKITDPELVNALATFICALCKTALTKKRVTATPQPINVNNRYRFRCFCLALGMIGSEYATARTRLMRDLSGNSGWLSNPPPKAPAPAPAEAEEPAALGEEALVEAPAEEAAAE